MNPFPQITFVVEQFSLPSPGQQLLDRFLLGYNAAGAFHRPGARVVMGDVANPLLESRARQFGLVVEPNLDSALAGSHAAVIVPTHPARPNPEILSRVLERMPRGGRCFVYGLLAGNAPAAEALLRQAQNRGIALETGTAVSAAFRLPAIEISAADVRRALVVSYGSEMELDAIEVWRSLIGSRMEKPAQIESMIWNEVWDFAYSPPWRPLFAAAVSRSNTIQGDPVKDGRTQDIVGLRIVEKLVPKPRAWRVTQSNGLAVAILDLTGALEDLNFAVEMASGALASAQLYRPPAPMQDHFSPLAERLERFFRVDVPEPPPDFAAHASLHERMARG